MLRVSVVIPCYNRANTIGEAIRSVHEQSRQAFELIVVDDASTDDSADLAAAAGARVIRLPENGGNSRARNIGMRAAQGDAVAWLDSDDYWEPNHLAIVAGLLERYPEAAVASAAIRLFGDRSEVWYGVAPDGPANVLRRAFYETPVAMITSVVRINALLASGGFDETERYSEDFDFWLRMALRHRFVASTEITANYRWHSGQLSANPERQWNATYKFRKRALDQVVSDGNHELASQLAVLFRQRWADDLQAAWDEDRVAWLRQLVDLGGIVPGASKRTRLMWHLRSRIPISVRRSIRAARERHHNTA